MTLAFPKPKQWCFEHLFEWTKHQRSYWDKLYEWCSGIVTRAWTKKTLFCHFDTRRNPIVISTQGEIRLSFRHKEKSDCHFDTRINLIVISTQGEIWLSFRQKEKSDCHFDRRRNLWFPFRHDMRPTSNHENNACCGNSFKSNETTILFGIFSLKRFHRPQGGTECLI